MMVDMNEEELQALYAWIDEIPLSRQKKNVTRDFSDGVMVAEMVHYFLPKLVELHNYSPANSTPQKVGNWRLLNRKVFSKLNFNLPDDLLQSVAASKPGVIEFILSNLRNKIERYLQNQAMRENAKKEQELAHESFNGPQMYGGEMYDPAQLASNYGSGGPYVYNPQEPIRHPGPVQPPNGHFMQVGLGAHGAMHYAPHLQSDMVHNPPALHHHNHTSQNPSTHLQITKAHSSSKIPPPNYHLSHLRQEAQKQNNSFSAPSLPPLNPGRNMRLTDRKALSNPEKRSKLPTLDKKYVYTRNSSLHSNPQQRDNSAGTQIRMAEREQKILESREYVQLLQMKVTRLEHLVQIKDMKIVDLTRQLEVSKHPLQKR